jgi:hypothetical protein
MPAGAPERIVGPFQWIPKEGENLLLMSVSAAGDASILRKVTPGSSIAEWRLIPSDNNIGARKV